MNVDADTLTQAGATAPAQARAVDTRSGWPAWPIYGLVDDLLPTLRDWAGRDRRAALATLVRITGSSPRPLGSEMAISDAGEVAGYVSGGCVEGAVATQAAQVIESGRPVMLDYGAGSPVLDVQLTCGGRIGIFVRPLPDLAAYVALLEEARLARRPLDIGIDLETGAHQVDATAPRDGSRYFTRRHLPPPRLLLVGADPVTLAVCRLAPLFGYETGLLRPYGPGSPPPGAELFYYDTRPLHAALAELPVDRWTAVYTLTHDMADDHAVIGRALQGDAFCVGALGSRHKSDERHARLRAEGFGDDALARLNTPAGLAIGAAQPDEIALSILAQVTAHKPRARSAS